MKKDNVKTVTIRCDDNAEAVVFSKYTMKNSTDFEYVVVENGIRLDMKMGRKMTAGSQ